MFHFLDSGNSIFSQLCLFAGFLRRQFLDQPGLEWVKFDQNMVSRWQMAPFLWSFLWVFDRPVLNYYSMGRKRLCCFGPVQSFRALIIWDGQFIRLVGMIFKWNINKHSKGWNTQDIFRAPTVKSKMSSSLSFAIPRLFCRIFAGMLSTMWWHAGSCIEYQLILSKFALNKLLRGTQTNVASGMVKD